MYKIFVLLGALSGAAMATTIPVVDPFEVLIAHGQAHYKLYNQHFEEVGSLGDIALPKITEVALIHYVVYNDGRPTMGLVARTYITPVQRCYKEECTFAELAQKAFAAGDSNPAAGGYWHAAEPSKIVTICAGYASFYPVDPRYPFPISKVRMPRPTCTFPMPANEQCTVMVNDLLVDHGVITPNETSKRSVDLAIRCTSDTSGKVVFMDNVVVMGPGVQTTLSVRNASSGSGKFIAGDNIVTIDSELTAVSAKAQMYAGSTIAYIVYN